MNHPLLASNEVVFNSRKNSGHQKWDVTDFVYTDDGGNSHGDDESRDEKKRVQIERDRQRRLKRDQLTVHHTTVDDRPKHKGRH